MRVHRFYIDPKKIELQHSFWLRDERVIPQWQKVLRFRPGQEVVLFDGQTHDRLYKIIALEPGAAHLEFVTDFERKLPKNDIYLFWALLKKDKNDWVLQKCTELSVNHFVPILSERCEKTGFNEDRAKKIIIEAAEQCGRSNIPNVREPLTLETALTEFKDKLTLYVCDEGGEVQLTDQDNVGIFIGPEGGWSDTEHELFIKNDIKILKIADLTLRAETACVAAATKLLQ